MLCIPFGLHTSYKAGGGVPGLQLCTPTGSLGSVGADCPALWHGALLRGSRGHTTFGRRNETKLRALVLTFHAVEIGKFLSLGEIPFGGIYLR